MTIMISVRNLDKTFTLHTQGGTVIPVFSGLNLDVRAGECVALAGASGSGKSSLICSLYGNYRPQSGSVSVRHQEEMTDIVTATPRAGARHPRPDHGLRQPVPARGAPGWRPGRGGRAAGGPDRRRHFGPRPGDLSPAAAEHPVRPVEPGPRRPSPAANSSG